MSDPAAPSEGRTIAVLTGDLVRSRDMTADQIAIVRARLTDVARDIDGWSPGLVIGGPQFFRGDSWQLALSRPGMFLRVAIAITAALRAMDMRVETRIGVGIGGAERINAKEISVSVGEAFLLSGTALDAMKGAIGLRVALASPGERQSCLSAIAALASALIGRWRPAQAESVWLSLAPGGVSQEDVAKRRGVKRQSVNDALTGAEFAALADAVEAVETVYGEQAI